MNSAESTNHPLTEDRGGIKGGVDEKSSALVSPVIQVIRPMAGTQSN
ncbi:MAG: hypothetical protein ACKVQS_01385 [Fimbriimonadaceae bacterium]